MAKKTKCADCLLGHGYICKPLRKVSETCDVNFENLQQQIEQGGGGGSTDYLTRVKADELYQPKADNDNPYARASDLISCIKETVVDGKKVVVLPADAQLMGTLESAIYALLSLRRYAQEQGDDVIQTEVGTTSFHLNLNSLDDVTYDTPDGKKTIATTDVATAESNGLMPKEDKAKIDSIDANQVPHMINLPLKTPLNKVFTQEEILSDWLHVASVEEFKQIIVRSPIYTRYGIQLSGKPMYYRQMIQYVAFESNTQIKFVWVGLNISDDVVSKYTFIVNLDGTLIGGTQCNASLEVKSLE